MIALVVLIAFAGPASGDDWPTYRHDAQRSGISSDEIAPPLSEEWVFTPTHPPSRAWGEPLPGAHSLQFDEPDRMRFDDAFHVAAVGDRVYFGSSSEDYVCALDAATGRVLWTFHTEGPVRMAPTVSKGKAYAGSDDGKVYCLDAAGGDLVWKFSAAPCNEKQLGNGRMISRWPVRTGVLVEGGVAYFGVGVFAYEGLYLCAVGATDGRIIWRNDSFGRGGYGHRKFNNVTLQGCLASSPDKLFAPGARGMPSVFSRRDGRFLIAPSIHRTEALYASGTDIIADGDLFFSATGLEHIAYSAESGQIRFTEYARQLAVGEQTVCFATGKELVAVRKRPWEQPCSPEVLRLKDRIRWLSQQVALRLKTRKERQRPKRLAEAIAKLREMNRDIENAKEWSVPCDCSESIALALRTVFVGGKDAVKGFNRKSGKELWSAKTDGKARGIAIANGRLFVSTDKGAIHCFVPGNKGTRRKVAPQMVKSPYPEDKQAETCKKLAESIVRDSGVERGYALVIGAGRAGQLAFELAGRTDLKILVAEPDARKNGAARKKLSSTGVYGPKVAVVRESFDALPFAPYFANLIVCPASERDISAAELLRLLKPCGGVACVTGSGGARWQKAMQAELDRLGEKGTRITAGKDIVKIVRGPLNGAGEWTHPYADPGKTACSGDQLVRQPMGILWYGDPGPKKMRDRHQVGANPLSFGGRVFIAEYKALAAYDIYNGLFLWERELPDIVHPSMSLECSPLASREDSLFVIVGKECLRLDPATGQTLNTYQGPADRAGRPSPWGQYVACVGDLLLGADMKRVFAVDVETGKPRWTYESPLLITMTISAGDGRVFFVDYSATEEQRKACFEELPPEEKGARRKKGGKMDGRLRKPLRKLKHSDVGCVVCLDAATGEMQWKTPQYLDNLHYFGPSRGGNSLETMCSGNVLILCAQPWNGHYWKQFLKGELAGRRVVAFNTRNGKVLWSGRKGYKTRPAIVGDMVIAEPWAWDLKTGEPRIREHPVTGKKSKWQIVRPGLHCGPVSAGAHTLFFRSFSSAYCDLTRDDGTVHVGGVRPGCSVTMLPVGGVVVSPEAGAGCICRIPFQCSMSLYPRQKDRAWGMFASFEPNTPVKNLYLNLGAPGDRRDDRGALWVSYPRFYAGHGPFLILHFDPEIETEGYFNHNPDAVKVEGTNSPWVFVSGARGIRKCTIPVIDQGQIPATYAVRLLFVELENDRPGERVFDVRLQGRTVLENLDIFDAAGGRGKSLVKEFSGVEVREKLKIEFVPKQPEPAPSQQPVLSAIELVRIKKRGEDVPITKFREPMAVYNLGYWYADFVREQAAADIALVPCKALWSNGTPYRAGRVTLGNLLGWLADKRVVKSGVKGDDLLRFLNTPEINERFNPLCPGAAPGLLNPLYESGLQVKYDPRTRKTVFDLDPNKTYSLAVLWPFGDSRKYGREAAPIDDAKRGVLHANLEVISSKAMDMTTWQMLEKKARELRIAPRYAAPLPEWNQWAEEIAKSQTVRKERWLKRMSVEFAKDMVLPGGVNWQLVAFDQFEADTLHPDWRNMRGRWTVKDGTLRSSGPSALALDRKMSIPVRIEFSARAKAPGDMAGFLATKKNAFHGYLVSFGANSNRMNVITRQHAGTLAESREPLAVPGQWHHIAVNLLQDRVQLIVDGRMVLDCEEPAEGREKVRAAAEAAGLFARASTEFDNVRIFKGNAE